MKKTLIALAALAASSVTFAQVSITGALQTGYQVIRDGAVRSTDTTKEHSGLGVYKSEVYFNVKEDLGGGYGLNMRMGLAGLDRSGESNSKYGVAGTNGPVTGRDATMKLGTPFGELTLGTVKLANYLYDTAGFGVAIDDLSDLGYNSGSLLLGRVRRDLAAFTLPMGPLSLSLVHYEAGNAEGLGLGYGAAGSNTQRVNQLIAAFAEGPIAANVQYLSYDNRNNDNKTNKDDIRLGGSYDLGVAKIGLAGHTLNVDGPANAKYTEYLIGASVPLGAVNLGLNWAKQSYDNGKDTLDKTGYLLGAKYSLSKRTSLDFQYTSYEAVANAAEKSENMYLLMSHKF